MSNELTTQIFTMSDIQKMASAIARPGLFGIKDEAQAFSLMLVAQAEGRHPATIALEYDIVQGRPAIKSMAALARFQQAGGKIQWIGRSDVECSAKFCHPLGGEVEICWTIERAKAAQLTVKDNWKKFPAQMLSARVVAEGVRACFPACLNGFYLSEEVADFSTKPTNNLAPETEAKKTQPKTQPEAPNESEISVTIRKAREFKLSDDEITECLATEDWDNAKIEGVRALCAKIREVIADKKGDKNNV